MNAKTTVTTAVNGIFDEKTEASLKAAAASVAESDAGNDEALETFARVLTPTPTFEMYTGAQKVFQAGYIAAMPDMSIDALAKRTSRFFSEVLKTYGITKPQSHDPAAEKKREQREKAAESLVAKYKAKKPETIKEEIKKGYAALAAGAPDSAEVKKKIKEAEQALKLMTKAETDKATATLKALRSSLIEYAKKATDYDKIKAAIIALK
jgi:hypothetical protein